MMKNTSKAITYPLLSIFLVLILLGVLLLSIGVFRCAFAVKIAMRDVKSENSNVPCYEANGQLHIDGEKIDVIGALWKKNRDTAYHEILCVSDQYVYFLYSENDPSVHNWTIATVDRDSKAVQDQYTVSDPKTAYIPAIEKPYAEKNVFYYDGNIVLNDFDTVYVYGINTKQVSQYRYVEYVFPQQEIYGEVIAPYTIELHIGEQTQSVCLQDIAETSNAIATIYNFRNKKNWQGNTWMPQFFLPSSIQTANDKIYAVGRFGGYAGEGYGVILEYDVAQNKWMYLDYFHCDTLLRDGRIIPFVGCS